MLRITWSSCALWSMPFTWFQNCGIFVAGAVDVNPLRMIRHDAIVVLGGIVILDHVIPQVPFPNDRAAVRPRRRHFDEGVGQHVALAGDAGIQQASG